MSVSLKKNVLDEAVKIVFNKSTFISRHHFNIFETKCELPFAACWSAVVVSGESI